MKMETIHTTFSKKDFDKFFYPFTDEGNVNKNEVIMQAMKILYELCKQNNTEINFASLLEVKNKIFRGEMRISEKIVIETDCRGKTVISIPKQQANEIEQLLSLIKDKAEKIPSEVLIIKKEADEPKNDINTGSKFPLQESILKYLKSNGGEVMRSNIRHRFNLSRQSMSNVLKELKKGGKIEKQKSDTIKLVENLAC